MENPVLSTRALNLLAKISERSGQAPETILEQLIETGAKEQDLPDNTVWEITQDVADRTSLIPKGFRIICPANEPLKSNAYKLVANNQTLKQADALCKGNKELLLTALAKKDLLPLQIMDLKSALMACE